VRSVARNTGVGLGIAAFALHLFVMTCFAGRWDKSAAVTVFPIWLWAAGGLTLSGLGWVLGRPAMAKVPLLVWLATLVLCADERRGLWRAATGHAAPGREAKDPNQLRVVTLNCHGNNLACAREVLAWQPDVVLLQEMRNWQQPALDLLAGEWWGAEASVVGGHDTAIVARGKLTPRQRTPGGQPEQFVQATLTLNGRSVEVLSVHLQGHVTDLRLHRWQTWRDHARNQRRHRLYLADVMSHQVRLGSDLPCLIGGDFNSPAGDRVFHTLERHFTDAFAEAGTGWGNTFRNDWPLLRIDQLWTTDELRCVSARAVKTEHSDHRMVVADFAW
jgi:endonuclease/exonuclease/phosphatase (EEP) superfamily protein YafD